VFLDEGSLQNLVEIRTLRGVGHQHVIDQLAQVTAVFGINWGEAALDNLLRQPIERVRVECVVESSEFVPVQSW
jgi:hypothetical protein